MLLSHNNLKVRLRVHRFIPLFFIAASAWAGELDTIGVTVLRQMDPTLQGTGVKVAQPEGIDGGSPGTNAFEVNPNIIGQPTNLFTWISGLGSTNVFPNSVGGESYHANSVAGNFYGNQGIYFGVATNVAHVDNYEANYFVDTYIETVTQTAIAARIVNQSFTEGLYDTILDQYYDNYAAKFNTLFVTGSERNGFPVHSPATCYNGIGVNDYNASNPPLGPTPDGRSKPDLTAPATETSFATPFVAGSAAVLLQAANRGDGGANTNAAGDIRTLKTLLLNGAVKPSDWTNGPATPLDARYGAGIVNVFNSWQQLKAGPHSWIETTSNAVGAAHPPGTNTNNEPSLAGWDFNSITNTHVGATYKEQVNHYYFNLTDSNCFTLTATLAWNRHNGAATANDLNLFLYNAANSNLVACSTSLVDNVEHLFLISLPPGRYDLQVQKNPTGQVTAWETYALAFEFFNVSLKISLTNNNAALSWPVAPNGFRLMSTTNLAPPSVWNAITNPVAVDTNTARNSVTVPAATATNQFFRLQRP